MAKMTFTARGLALVAFALLSCSDGVDEAPSAGDEAAPQVSTQRKELTGKSQASLESECVSALQPRLIMAPSEDATETAVQFEGKELNCGETYELVVTGPDGRRTTESLVADAQGTVESSQLIEGPPGEHEAKLYDSRGEEVAQLLSHNFSFRYGHLTWRAVGPRTAEFSLVNVFRRVYPGSGADGLVVTGDLFQETYGNTRLCFGDGTCTNALRYRVTSHDAAQGWVRAEAVTSNEFQVLPGTGVTVVETEPNGTIATANSMQLGDDYSSNISTASESDYVRFTLSQRTRIQVSTVLQTMGDSYLYLYGSSGTLLAADDDSGPGWASLIQITLDAGTYYIRAAGYSSNTGQQLVQLRQMAIPPIGPITYAYSSNGPFTAYAAGCCRIEGLGNPNNTSYHLRTRVGFSVTNSTPVSSLPPIVEAPTRTPDFSFQIPATDAEGDALTFRLADGSESSLWYPPTGLTVSSTGVVRWDTTRTISGQLWAVQVVIEERRNGVLIGSSPVDFLLQITGDSGSPPTCVPPPEARYTVLAGRRLEFSVGTQDPDAWDSVTLEAWNIPWSATLQPALPLQGPSGISTTFSYTPSVWDVGYVLTPTFKVTDTQGQTGECFVEVEVLPPDGWPPEAYAGSEQYVSEGDTVFLDGTGSFDRDGDPLTYHWAVVSSEGPPVTLSSDTSATPSFTTSNQGSYTFQLTVTDPQGNSGSAMVSVYVFNAPPQVIVSNGQADEGQVFTSVGFVTDPGGDPVTVMVNYGDGMGYQPLAVTDGTFTLSHRYLESGYYWVEIIATDDSGDQSYGFAEVEVRNVAPVMTYPPSLSGYQGQPLTAPISFTDPGEDYWWAWVDYGDGYGDGVWIPGQEFTLEHVYYGVGAYTLTLTLYDDDGGEQTVTIPVEIQNVAPTVTILSTEPTEEGGTFLGYGTFEDPGRWWEWHSIMVDYGDGTGPQPADRWGEEFWLWHEYADSGTYVVTVTVTDSYGGVGTATATVVVNNVAPWVYLEEHYDTYEGRETWLRAEVYDQGLQDTWTATVDYGDGTGEQPVEVYSNELWLTHVYATEGVYTLTLTVRDDDGGVTTATTQVTVYNAPPEVFVTDGGAYEGSLFTSSGTFTDPGSDTWTAMVDYGDGTGWQPLELDGQSFTLAHVYPNDGQYLLRVAVMDDGGEVGVGYASITIFNVAPTVAITGGTANEGSVSNISATIIDPGQEDSWWVLINYGDGTYSEWRTVNNRDFTLNHVYADNGTYTVTFQVWDDDGSGSATAQVVVHNVAPTVTVTGGTTNEGSSITLIGTHDDPGRLDRAVLAHVDYGDGSPVQTFVPYWWGSYALSHTYADNGTYQVTLSVIDDDGGVGTATSTVVVNNVAPSVYLEDSWYGFGEGTPATLRGGFYDPGQQDTWTATVNYGDGTGEQPLALTSSFITLSHVYANNGAYTVTLTVRDDDGGVGTVTRQVNVYNAAPVVSASGGIINEGSTFTSSGSFTDPGADTWTARVNYGDGTGWQPLALNGKSFALEHVYGNDGNYYVQIVVRDSDGAEGSAWAYVTVRNVAPVVTATGGTGNEGSAITISGTITDPGQESFWTAWIDYGDGTSAGYYLTSRSFTVNHVYADNRTYTVTIRVSDSFWGDSEGRTTTQVVVHNVAPTVTATGDTGYEGASITLRASYTDPGSLDTAVARINYGDGSPVETISLRSWERSFTMSHRYADNGIYLVTVSVIDDDGGVGTATVPMEVRNVTPALQPVVSCSPNEGALCAISGEFLDPGADSWTVTVNFGDGSAAQEISLGVGSSRAYAASHVYDDNGLYTVAVTVMDDDGGRSTSTHLVQVRNVAPTATASNDSPQYWGVPVTLVGTATDPSQADTQAGFTALWTLGDDTTASELTTAHTYAAPGTYAALLSVTDKDGGTNTIPVMTTVTIRKRPGAVTCQDTTVTFGFPAALGARFMDGLAGGLTGGRSLSFRLGGSTGLGSATTDATGRASVQSPGDLVPGSYPVTVSFAEDSHYTATEATCTLTVTESHGTIIGGGLRLSNNSRGGFNVRREEGGSVQGELQFQSDSTSFHAHELTALGISADHRQGWFAGVGRDGRSFTAYVEDNGEPGNADVFRLWIDGVLQTGDGNGTISGGNIQFHDHRS